MAKKVRKICVHHLLKTIKNLFGFHFWIVNKEKLVRVITQIKLVLRPMIHIVDGKMARKLFQIFK